MNWEDLRHFLALARTGSLSEAARQLGVDHTTVARRVAALEAALGLRLIDRLPRAVVLTAEGTRIAERGAGLEGEAFAVLRAARGADPATVGRVRLSAPPAVASHFLAARLGGLWERHPGIVVELLGDARAADLDRREADIALRLARPDGDSLIARRIGRLTYGLYATPGVAARTGIADTPLLGYDDSLDHVPQQQWLRRLFPDRPMVLKANDVVSLAAAAGAGLGLAALPDFLGRDDPRLVAVSLLPGAPPPSRDLWLVVHDDLRKAPRIRAVMDFLAEAVGQGL